MLLAHHATGAETFAQFRSHEAGAVSATALAALQTAVTVSVLGVWAVTSDPSGWFSGWRRADSRLLRRLLGLTGKACVARRRPRIAGVT